MRELKFRAWDKEKSRWVREYDYQLEDQEDPAYEEEYGEDSGWLDGDVASDLDLVNGGLATDLYVWEQFTGLKDKNGKEIYEGDIVNITAVVETDDSDMACIIDTNSIVCWDKEHARWDVNDEPESKDWDYRRRRYFVFVDSEDRENVEVIGNIHENPELLGGEA
jgi:uncharacterized phage protein (TIGR01671 family)